MPEMMLPQEIREKVDRLLRNAKSSAGLESGATFTIETLGGDGSNRRFWRLVFENGRKAIVIAPEKHEEQCLREADAVYHIGSHLGSCGVPVPELYGYDNDNGILLCEDLGQVHLHTFAVATDWQDVEAVERLKGLYQQTLDVLAAMQVQGREGFNPDWCWDTPRYDRQLMVARESGYFLQAFWQGVLAQPVPDGLGEEFSQLADAAAMAPADFFLHRDFQSRNIMIIDGRVRVIDFQGGRLGPLGYDLASLLLDPYAALPESFQDELYAYYLARLSDYHQVDAEMFHSWYQVLALQRNLQILGAFAHLSAVVGKPFFRSYIAPALLSLHRLSLACRHPRMPVLGSVTRQALNLIG